MTTKRRGRPPLDPTDRVTAEVHLRLSSQQFDSAYTRAQASRVSVPEWIRRTVRDAIDDPTGDRKRPRS